MFSCEKVVLLGNKQVESLKVYIMGKKNKKAAYSKREEEKAKKVVRNLIIGLVVIAAGFILVSQLV